MSQNIATSKENNKKWYKHLYIQVIIAIIIGIGIGHFYPSVGVDLKPLGDTFIKLR